jgi:hypothetical protein
VQSRRHWKNPIKTVNNKVNSAPVGQLGPAKFAGLNGLEKPILNQTGAIARAWI